MRINFFGGPGVGKSTLAALTFGWLRARGESAELVQEWVKAWAYLGRQCRSFDEVFVLANQMHAEDQFFQAGVKLVVTDSPLYLQCVYALRRKMKVANDLWKIATRFEEAYPSINFIVDRDPDVAYEQAGRYENLNDAVAMDRLMTTCLRDWNIPVTHVKPSDLDSVLKVISKQLAAPKGRKKK